MVSRIRKRDEELMSIGQILNLLGLRLEQLRKEEDEEEAKKKESEEGAKKKCIPFDLPLRELERRKKNVRKEEESEEEEPESAFVRKLRLLRKREYGEPLSKKEERELKFIDLENPDLRLEEEDEESPSHYTHEFVKDEESEEEEPKPIDLSKGVPDEEKLDQSQTWLPSDPRKGYLGSAIAEIENAGLQFLGMAQPSNFRACQNCRGLCNNYFVGFVVPKGKRFCPEKRIFV
jgi:hypothetical protein